MSVYRYYGLAGEESIHSAWNSEAGSDAEALEHARVRLGSDCLFAVEVWDGVRFVGRTEKSRCN